MLTAERGIGDDVPVADGDVYAIGVDIGGTKAAFGAVSSEGALVGYQEFELVGRSYDTIVEVIAEQSSLLRSAMPPGRGTPTALGVGVAGWLDSARNVVRQAPNLGWFDVPLRRDLARRTGCAVTLSNDGDAAAWGEWVLAGRSREGSVISLTLGTDVGGGVIVDGALVTGASGLGGELGHLVVDPGGPVCVCGNRGCLAVYASGTAMLAAARAAVPTGGLLARLCSGDPATLTGPAFSHAAQAGDSAALSVVAAAAHAIALASTQISRILDRHTLTLGGGAAAIGGPLLSAVEQALRAQPPFGPVRALPLVRLAQAGNAAGVRGAADLAAHQAHAQNTTQEPRHT